MALPMQRIFSPAAARWDKHARANDTTTTTARKISKESLGLRNNRNNQNKRKMLGVVPTAGWRFFLLLIISPAQDSTVVSFVARVHGGKKKGVYIGECLLVSL